MWNMEDEESWSPRKRPCTATTLEDVNRPEILNCYIDLLPNEILCRLFEFCDEASQMKCQRVCRRWYAVMQTPLLHKQARKVHIDINALAPGICEHCEEWQNPIWQKFCQCSELVGGKEDFGEALKKITPKTEQITISGSTKDSRQFLYRLEIQYYDRYEKKFNRPPCLTLRDANSGNYMYFQENPRRSFRQLLTWLEYLDSKTEYEIQRKRKLISI